MRKVGNHGRVCTRALTLSGMVLGAATLAPSPAGAQDAVSAVASHAVTQKNLQYNPGEMTIGVGDTVTWTNHETDGQTVHSVVQQGGSEINSPDIPPETSFSWTFTQPEEYHFICRFHPDMFMTLHVVAQAPAKGGNGKGGKATSTGKSRTKKGPAAPAPVPAMPSHADSASKSVPAPPPGPPDSTIPGIAGLPFSVERDRTR